MLMPSIYGENLFDDFFDDFLFFGDKELKRAEKKLYGRKAGRIMTTDIKEGDDGYELEMDLPGFKKEDIKISLENGFLAIQAAKGFEQSGHEKAVGRYIRKERYAGACSRSFYVGENLQKEDIRAEFKHGILKLFVPKNEYKATLEEDKYITIEG